ncbi:MAG: AarF/ABC1/UbiB kinase family protein [Deltaproteobacteria bacterium]|nr:AarF/ABC1/UbiB kinase family protein [Deltaproteobacteria bacterium]
MLRDLRRLQRIARIVGKYGYERFVVRGEGADPEPQPRPALVGTETGDLRRSGSAARRFRMMLEELGPTFIKLGQVLSARPDLISGPYVEELRTLQDRCEPIPFSEIEATLVDALKKPVAECFREISEAPLATASIAQVHRAVTKQGASVVIKVQRPGILDDVTADLEILYRFARLLDVAVEESGVAEPIGIVREFDRALMEELNFQHEAANLREFRRLHAQRFDIVIPHVFPELTSTKVLTMSYLEGVPLSRLPEDVDRRRVAERVLAEAFDEVFVDGVFHADPHPGNILFLSDGRYGILDLGLLGRLTPQMKETLVILALGVVMEDAESVARTLYRLGQSQARVDMGAVRDDTASLFQRYAGRSLGDVQSTVLIQDLLGLAMKHKIRVPAEYTMLARSAATVEGIVRSLAPDLDIAQVARPYAERLLVQRAAPFASDGGFYRALLQIQGISHDVPLQVSQILSDLSSGKFGVNVSGHELERLHASLLMAATTVAGSILGAAFIVGAFIGLARVNITIFGIPIAGVVGGAVSMLLLFWTGAYVLFKPRLKKISLMRWFVRRRP